MVITLDRFGRIIIPKRFRENLGINFGASLNISEDGNRIVIELVQKLLNQAGISTDQPKEVITQKLIKMNAEYAVIKDNVELMNQ